MPKTGLFRAGLVALALFLAPALTRAESIIDEWADAKFPAPPKLKPAKVDAKQAVLLMMDFTTQTCGPERRPRCAASIPKLAKLLADARSKGVLVIYSIAGTGATPASIVQAVGPSPGEMILPALGPDKFIGSDLEQTLKARSIKTVIAVGTQAQTSVLHTASAAALRGFTVIVPVDGMSSDDLFPELYTAWHLSTASRIADKVTLTRTDMISY
jgi:nicotinamidase-related amidase